MNIVLYQWKSYQHKHISETLQQLGHQVNEYTAPITNPEEDADYVDAFIHYLSYHPCTCVFSINYFPVLSKACMHTGIPYISWTCDSPLIAMHHTSIFNDCNYIFVFDKMDYLKFKTLGVPHIFYLPLGTSVITDFPKKQWNHTQKYAVSFVGSLYTKNTYDQVIDKLPSYLKGYLDCALEAQLQIAGGNLLYQLLTPEICETLEKISDYHKSPDSFSDLQLLFANTILGFKAASLNRIRSLHALTQALLPLRGDILSSDDGVHLFTNQEDLTEEDLHNLLPLIHLHGAVDYNIEMPEVFHSSRINLNFTIPNIQTGLPLRIWDIMGAGGFLLTNEQAEIPELLTPGSDLETFASMDELLEKCKFYLKHEEKRQRIARQGWETVQHHYTCKQQLIRLLKQVEQIIL